MSQAAGGRIGQPGVGSGHGERARPSGRRAGPPGGGARLSIELGEGATVDDLRAALAEREPQLAPVLAAALTVVGGEQAERSRTLAAGEEVAFLIPVAGGAG